MRRRSWTILFASALLVTALIQIIPAPVCASDITVFGKTYTRATQKPQVFVDTFTLSQPDNEFVLTVKNGKDGKFRVSAALIWINGKQVVEVSDFNNQVDLITRDVVLKAANEIKVELRSKPGDFITINIIGLNINTPPVADAGRDQTALAGEAVTLDGSGSTDADMDPLTYSWSFASRPAGSAAALINPLTVNPTFQIDKPGQYAVQLVVNDGEADSAPDTVAIATINSPPTAEAGPDQSVHAGNLVRLNGSGSSDVDGDGLTFSWSFAEKPQGSASVLTGGNTVEPTFAADLPGTYTVQLVVNDGHVNSVPDTVAITTTNTRPVADAGPDQSVVLGVMVTLDGSGSTDVDGDPLLYFWTLTEKPAGSAAVLTDAAAVKPTFMADRPGMYVVHLFVNDGLADSGQDTVVISTINSVPAAEAGPGQSVFVGDTVTLDGSGSHDADGDALTYFWSLAVRPSGSAAALSDASAVKPTFTADKPGTYVAQLIVNDGKADSAPDTVTITTVNSQPVSDAGPDQTTYVTQTVTLDGSGSSDVDGNLLTFSWSLTTRPGGSAAALSDATAVKPAFTVDKSGTYVAQLIVNDGTVDSAPDTVTVSTQNTAPVASAGPDQTVSRAETVQLDGSGSSDVDGDALSYSWSFSSLPPGSAASLVSPLSVNPTFVTDVRGDYVIQLIVSDGMVESTPDTVTITTSNSKPVARAGENQSVIVGATVTLDGSASSDADGDPLSYSWSIIAKPGGSAAELSSPKSVQPSFTPDLIGTYVIQLIVHDGIEGSDPDSVTIEVSVQPNRAPVAVNDGYGTDEDAALLVGAGMGVLANDGDPDANAIAALLVGNVAHGALTFNGDGSFSYTPDPNYHGVDSFSYSATDGLLSSNTATVSIAVRSVNDAPIADAGENQNVATGATVQLNGSLSSDPDGDALTYQWALTSKPDGSAAILSDASIVNPTFVADKAGAYEARLIVNDGTDDSGPDTIRIDAISLNRPPVAQDQALSIPANAPAVIVFRGSDPDGDLLAFQIATNPLYGNLSGAAPLFTYTPKTNYSGQDSFTYRVDDGKGGTDTATIIINICSSLAGLVAYYPFNGNANDESGNGNHGLIDGPSPAEDRNQNPRSALSFDGIDDYIQVGSPASLKMSNFMSITAWIYPTGPGSHATAGGTIVCKEGEYEVARFPDGTIRWAFANTNPGWTWGNTGYVAPLGQWTQITVVYDAGVIRTYAGAVLVHTFNGSGSIGSFYSNQSDFRIGGRQAVSQFFEGFIDGVRIHNRALSGSELSEFDGVCGSPAASNHAPCITSMPLTVAGVSHEYSYQVVAGDPDGDFLAYSIPVVPTGMIIDQAGLIRWTPGTASDFQVSVQVSDGFGGQDTQSFWIRVGKGNFPSVNTPPIAHAGDDFTMEENKQDQLDASHSFDADGDHLTYTWTQTAGPAVKLDSTTVQKPRFTTPVVDKNTLLTFELLVNDGLADSAAAKINVMVLNMDIWPDGSGMVTNCNPDGPGSLKAAVDFANAHSGTRITFGIPEVVNPAIGPSCFGTNTPGVWTLAIPSRPCGSYICGIQIDADGTFIDGASQTENQGDRNLSGPEIEITEDNVQAWPFIIAANDVVVRGLVINRQPFMGWHSPPMRVSAGENGVIIGTYIGTDATGTTPLAYMRAEGVGEYGIEVENSASNDYSKKSLIHNLRIGGSRQGEGNIISSFFGSSISIAPTYDGWAYNQPLDAPGPVTIQGNLIGIDRTGSRPLLSDVIGTGISITQGKNILIGGVTRGGRNIISSPHLGIYVGQFNSSYPPGGNITIQGNYFGTDITGTVNFGAFSNSAINMNPGGVEHPGSTEWSIGGSVLGAGNLIVSNGYNAIVISDDAGAIPSIKIQGNFVGTDASGTGLLGNGADGITIGGGRIRVGGTGPGEGNVIGGQRGSGIVILGTAPANAIRPSVVEVKGNRIGIGVDGITPIPNQHGISIASGFPLVVGGTQPGDGNTIAFNRGNGVNFPLVDAV